MECDFMYVELQSLSRPSPTKSDFKVPMPF